MPLAKHSAEEPITLGWKDGLTAAVLPFGARLSALEVPSSEGLRNVVLGYESAAAYRNDRYFMGCTIGRVCNRIAGARFVIDGAAYELPANEGANHLHGGAQGFHAHHWQVLALDSGARRRLILGYRSVDGEGGYPGTVEARATFEIEVDALNVTLEAWADRATPVNMTFHPYFNLSGQPGRTIHDHELTIMSDEILAVDERMIPTGARKAVQETPFDFRLAAQLGQRLAMSHPQLGVAAGFDHNFVLLRDAPLAAELCSRSSGLTMRLRTNQPGLQLYTGHHLQGGAGRRWSRHCGVCLEPQNFPDAVNQPSFPSSLLQPGMTYRNEIRYEFATLGGHL